jgi:hypothetical protein
MTATGASQISKADLAADQNFTMGAIALLPIEESSVVPP